MEYLDENGLQTFLNKIYTTCDELENSEGQETTDTKEYYEVTIDNCLMPGTFSLESVEGDNSLYIVKNVYNSEHKILLDDVPYKNNLALKAIKKVQVPLPGSLNAYSDKNVNDIFIFKNHLHYYASNKHYVFNGKEWEQIGTNSSISGLSYIYKPIEYNNELYVIGTNYSYPVCYKINLNPYSWTNLGTIPYSSLGSNANVYDIAVVNGNIYMSIYYGSTYHIVTFNISNLSFTEICNVTTDYSTNYKQYTNLINYKNELYVINGWTNSNAVGVPILHKLVNNQLQEVCSLPVANVSTSQIIKNCVMGDYLYICIGISKDTSYQIYRYDGEKWEVYAQLPRDDKFAFNSKNKSTLNNDYMKMIAYNDTIHLFNTNGNTYYFTYNEYIKEWLLFGYWICKIDDQT